MRCRGLAGPLGVTLTCRFLDCHASCPAYCLVSSSRTSSGRPAIVLTSGSPLGGPAVQVVNEFLLPPAMTAQGLRASFSKILFCPQDEHCLSPAVGPYPPNVHTCLHSPDSGGQLLFLGSELTGLVGSLG
jgi:hypothetical protein